MLFFSLETIVGVILIFIGIKLSLKKFKEEKESMKKRKDDLVYKHQNITDWTYWTSFKPLYPIGIYITILGIMCLVQGAQNVFKILTT